MKSLQEITKEINKLTSKIEQEYPELYQHLNENPITLPDSGNPEISIKNFSNYLNSLRELLDNYIESNKVK